MMTKKIKTVNILKTESSLKIVLELVDSETEKSSSEGVANATLRDASKVLYDLLHHCRHCNILQTEKMCSCKLLLHMTQQP